LLNRPNVFPFIAISNHRAIDRQSRRTFAAGRNQQKPPYQIPHTSKYENRLPKITPITHRVQPPFHLPLSVVVADAQFARRSRPERQPWANIPTNQEPLPPNKSTHRSTGFFQPTHLALDLPLFSQIHRILARVLSCVHTGLQTH